MFSGMELGLCEALPFSRIFNFSIFYDITSDSVP